MKCQQTLVREIIFVLEKIKGPEKSQAIAAVPNQESGKPDMDTYTLSIDTILVQLFLNIFCQENNNNTKKCIL